VIKGAVARRYAEAVLEIGVQQRTLDRWLADIRLIGEAFGNRQLAFVLGEPKIPAQRKELIVRDLLASKVQPDALNLALLLVEDDLVEVAPRLAQEFERLYNDYRGQAVAIVTSALPLDADERALVARDLQSLTGKRILMQERVDPSILGGVVARVGDMLVDGSVRRRLALLREQIVKGGGSFGGPLDGQPSPDGSPDGGPPGGVLADDTAPVVKSPEAPSADGSGAPGASNGGAREDGGNDTGTAGSTSSAPRAADAPHFAPRSGQGPPGSQG
jgi:F-type H+-transporting ATPase subunit delta